MYPTELKHGLKLNPYNKFDHNIMLKTIQNLCYKNTPFNMTSPFLVDNILHQQKTAEFHNQYLNQQIENYVLQRQNYEQSRENSPEIDEAKTLENDDEKQDSIEDSKVEDEDSKSREDFVKNEYFNNDFYQKGDEKEVLNIPNLNRRCQSCGDFSCPPFACKKSGIRRLEELEKRFNFNYQENSDEDGKERYNTEEMVRSCEEFEQKKPLLKFSVSAILGDREDSAVKSNVGELRIVIFLNVSGQVKIYRPALKFLFDDFESVFFLLIFYISVHRIIVSELVLKEYIFQNTENVCKQLQTLNSYSRN